MKAYDGHYWRDDDGYPWTPWNTVNDRCRAVVPGGHLCGLMPDSHPQPWPVKRVRYPMAQPGLLTWALWALSVVTFILGLAMIYTASVQ